MEAELKRQKNIIDNNRTFLVENLDHEDVIDQLIQCDLVGQFAAQQLRLSDKSKQEKNRIIVDQLYSDGPGAVEKFCRILRNRKRQAYIADQLEGCKALLYFRFKEKNPSLLGVAPTRHRVACSSKDFFLLWPFSVSCLANCL